MHVNALQALGIHYEYHYAILPTALPSNFVLFKKTFLFNKNYTWNQRIENLQWKIMYLFAWRFTYYYLVSKVSS